MAYDPGNDDIPEPKVWFTIKFAHFAFPFGPLEFWGSLIMIPFFIWLVMR